MTLLLHYNPLRERVLTETDDEVEMMCIDRPVSPAKTAKVVLDGGGRTSDCPGQRCPRLPRAEDPLERLTCSKLVITAKGSANLMTSPKRKLLLVESVVLVNEACFGGILSFFFFGVCSLFSFAVIPYFSITTDKMKVMCAALCVQAVGAFIAPSVTRSGE